jgi:ABC-type phosphate transport system permease subunit
MTGKSTGNDNTIVANISGGFDRIRKPLTWIYCSAILFPLGFAVVAAFFTTFRNRAHIDGSIVQGAFTSFYLVLMAMLASVPRSILPALMIWILIAKYRPLYDENKVIRYLGLAVLLAAALFAHSRIYDRPFNFLWLTIAFMAVVLPRLAFPSLRSGLKEG